MGKHPVEKEQIIAAYKQCHSIKQTARDLQISHNLARRVLIEAGLYTNARAQQIYELYDAGLSPQEIEKRLSLSHSTVIEYLPYTKGYSKTVCKTLNARRIAACRAKKKKVHSK